MKVRTYKLARAIAVGLATSALVAPSALAAQPKRLDPWGSDALQHRTATPAPLGEHGTGQNATWTASEPKASRALLAVKSTASVSGEPKNVAPFVAEGQRRRHGDPLVVAVPQSQPGAVRIVQRPGGFDWGDAGAGGAAMLALVLLVAAATALRHAGRRQEARGSCHGRDLPHARA